MLLHPLVDVVPAPDPAGAQLGFGLREVVEGANDAVDALTADSQKFRYLGNAHEMVRHGSYFIIDM